MTQPDNTFTRSAVSTTGNTFVHHVILSSIVTLLFGMETNAKVKLDRLSLFNNLLNLIDGILEHQAVDRNAVNLLVQQYLDRLIEKGFIEEEEGNYTLTETGRILGKIKHRSMKKMLLAVVRE